VANLIQQFPDNDITGQLKRELSTMDDFLSKRDLSSGLPYETINKGDTPKRPMTRKVFYAKGQ